MVTEKKKKKVKPHCKISLKCFFYFDTCPAYQLGLDVGWEHSMQGITCFSRQQGSHPLSKKEPPASMLCHISSDMHKPERWRSVWWFPSA